MTDMFARSAQDYTGAAIPDTFIKANTRFVAKLLSAIVIMLYIMAKTPAVLNNELSLGIFLATITIFATYLGDAFSDLNGQLELIIETFSPLKDFTMFLNMPLELPALKRTSELSRVHTQKRRLEIFNTPSTTAFKVDLIKIEVCNLSFEYIPGIPVLQDVNL